VSENVDTKPSQTPCRPCQEENYELQPTTTPREEPLVLAPNLKKAQSKGPLRVLAFWRAPRVDFPKYWIYHEVSGNKESEPHNKHNNDE
jgi:hypothetical protein